MSDDGEIQRLHGIPVDRLVGYLAEQYSIRPVAVLLAAAVYRDLPRRAAVHAASTSVLTAYAENWPVTIGGALRAADPKAQDWLFWRLAHLLITDDKLGVGRLVGDANDGRVSRAIDGVAQLCQAGNTAPDAWDEAASGMQRVSGDLLRRREAPGLVCSMVHGVAETGWLIARLTALGGVDRLELSAHPQTGTKADYWSRLKLRIAQLPSGWVNIRVRSVRGDEEHLAPELWQTLTAEMLKLLSPN